MTCAEFRAAVEAMRTRITRAELAACHAHIDTCPACAVWLDCRAAEAAKGQTPAQQALSAAEGLARGLDLTRREATDPELRVKDG